MQAFGTNCKVAYTSKQKIMFKKTSIQRKVKLESQSTAFSLRNYSHTTFGWLPPETAPHKNDDKTTGNEYETWGPRQKNLSLVHIVYQLIARRLRERAL
jgi:hypothetical protein